MASGIAIREPGVDDGTTRQSAQSGPPKPGKRDFSHLGIDDADRRKILDCIRQYRDSWMTNRLELFRDWGRNSLFRKGVQCLGWNPGTNSWFDALAQYRASDQMAPGENADLEPFVTNVTLLCCNVWTGILASALPRTVVDPVDATVPKDVKAAKAAKTAIESVHRKNGAEELLSEAFESQFDFGTYFRHVRAVFDGDLFGVDQVAAYEDFEVRPPARMKCRQCGKETPLTELAPGGHGELPACPGCGATLGPESYYAEGEGGTTGLRMAGMKEVPRAGVKETIHDPREIDMDPKGKRVAATPLLAHEWEIDIGEAREMHPDLADSIQEGAVSPTSANSEYERFRRLEGYAMAANQTSDMNQSSVTYSEVWCQPRTFYRTGDKEFGDKMKRLFPKGLMIANLGEETTEIRSASLVREWTQGKLQQGFGAYPPAIANRVVPFNRRINAANQLVDEQAMRASMGLNLMRASMGDQKKIAALRLSPMTIIPVPDKINGEPRPLGDTFAHFDTPMAPEMWNYASSLYTFLMLVAELPPQVQGTGTTVGVETGMGQSQMLDRALTTFRRYWMNAKREAAQSDENIVYWLKQLMQAGAIQQLWDVRKDQGGSYQNETVYPADLDGDCSFTQDPDQNLPATAEEIREAILSVFSALNNQNPAAAEWFDDPENQAKACTAIVPGSNAPSESQRLKTLGDLAKLAELKTAPPQAAAGADGAMQPVQLPAAPSLSDNLDISERVAAKYMQDNASRQYDGTPAWQWWQLYYDAIGEVRTVKLMKQAQRQMRITQAGQPPKQPDAQQQTMQQEFQLLMQQAAPAILRLAQIAQMDPSLTKGTASAQVSAGKEIVDTTVKAADLINK